MKSNFVICAVAISILFFLFSCNQNTGSATYILHPHETIEEDSIKNCTSIFLAGTIDMGNSIDWQNTVAEYFKSNKGRYLLFNPRQLDWNPDLEGEMDYQVNWELEHLEQADIIIMNFLPDSQSPITLLELGLYARSGKLRVVCPPSYFRYDNVRITCKRYGVRIYPSIELLLNEIVSMK